MFSRATLVRYFACPLLLLFVFGCSSREPGTYPVSGSVTWEGEPLAEGDIIFTPVDSGVAPSAGKIVDGEYEFDAREGEVRVEINATREVGAPDPVMNSRRRVSFIPERYNTNTELTATVSSSGENKFDFDLTQKPAGK